MKHFFRIALLGAIGGPLILILTGLLRNFLATDSAIRQGMDIVYSAVNAPIQPWLRNMDDHEMALAMFALCAWWVFLGLGISVGTSILVRFLRRTRGHVQH